MPRHNNLNLHLCRTLHDSVEVVHFEPKKYAIAIRPVGAIGNRPVMMLNFEAMQLQDQRSILHQLFILLAAVRATATEQALIPAAAGFDIGDTDERLRAHGSKFIELYSGNPIFL